MGPSVTSRGREPCLACAAQKSRDHEESLLVHHIEESALPGKLGCRGEDAELHHTDSPTTKLDSLELQFEVTRLLRHVQRLSATKERLIHERKLLLETDAAKTKQIEDVTTLLMHS